MKQPDTFAGHSASWIEGWKSRDRVAQIDLTSFRIALSMAHYELRRLKDDIWDMKQSKIDNDAWLVVKGVIIGISIMLVAFYLGAVFG